MERILLDGESGLGAVVVVERAVRATGDLSGGTSWGQRVSI